jgi:hypothetical protein
MRVKLIGKTPHYERNELALGYWCIQSGIFYALALFS